MDHFPGNGLEKWTIFPDHLSLDNSEKWSRAYMWRQNPLGWGVVEFLALCPQKLDYAPSHRFLGATSHRIFERKFCGEFP